MANQITMTFAGETKDLEGGFDRVGASAKGMGDKVAESGAGFDRAAEAADNVDTKAMGFRDTLTGLQDTAKGTSLVMKGDLFNGLLTLGAGIGDLGSGFYNLIIPALKGTKVATLASAAASKVAAGASKVWAGAQLLMNGALWASPLTWIVIAIVAVIAVIVLIATKTNWFQRIWKAAWGGIQRAASATWEWLKKLPGWIGGAFSSVAHYIADPFKAAFNQIARAWNNTIGRLSWSVPGWVPGIGGNSISVPNLPTFHAGGTVPGYPGQAVPIMAMAGETVSSNAGGTGDGGWVAIRGDGLIDALTKAIADRVSAKGGRAAQLGIRFA
jgi:hypothetical protein